MRIKYILAITVFLGAIASYANAGNGGANFPSGAMINSGQDNTVVIIKNPDGSTVVKHFRQESPESARLRLQDGIGPWGKEGPDAHLSGVPGYKEKISRFTE